MMDCLKLNLSDEEIGNMGSLALAYIGDAVFELLIRTWVCKNKAITSKKMHRVSVSLVNAHAQSVFSEKIMTGLSDEETAVFKRGRNAKVNAVPKNASVSDYHRATGLEALLGYLYLKGRDERIKELFEKMIEE